MKGLTKRLLALVICAAVFAGCGNPWMKRITASLYDKPEVPGMPAQTGSDKAIMAFDITSPVSATGFIDEAAKTIAVTVPYDTVVTGLVPSIKHTGISVSPPSDTAQDFTNPVSYTVTAADGSTETYTVTVTAASASDKAITVFNITTSPVSEGVINEGAKTIAVAVPYGTPVSSLIPDITHIGASISPASGMEQNFTNPVFYTVTAADGSTVIYTVTVTAASTLNSVADIGVFLAAASGGTSGSPVDLPLDIDLAADWIDLLNIIATASPPKYVSLDLSDSTMTGMTGTPGEFDPDYTNSIGKQYVTALTLPDTATSIAAGSHPYSTFTYFSNLREIDGEQVTAIREDTFINCASLESVALPAATTIGTRAFYGCASLTSVTLSEAILIGEWAFYACTSLTAVALPKATTINPSVFVGCTSLISVSLPEATSIYDRAFQSCTALSDLYFQTTSPPTLYGGNGGPFYWTGPSGTLTIHVPSGMVSAYESVWGVAASTSAYGNPSVYGNNHKAIEIVD